jgi:uncharacterized protein
MNETQTSANRWIPSRYNEISYSKSGDLLVYNSYTGAIASFSDDEKSDALDALRASGIEGELPDSLRPLFELGFLVAEQTDEDRRALFLHQSLHRTDLMHLVILPTEACNFRCAYCYQTFSKGKMTDETKEGLKKYVEQQASHLKHLSVSWFGGEPLLAQDVIGELSEAFLSAANKYGMIYSADMTTNGYGLTKPMLQQLLGWNIRRFMVTVDGSEDAHDARRHLRGGGKTFSRIMENLTDISHLKDDFECHIRINFDHDNLDEMKELMLLLGPLFSGDRRFQIYFRPVGRWGGTHDDRLSVCAPQTADTKIWELTEFALHRQLVMSSYIENTLLPAGAVCYAAKPHSLVVGSDGRLYKCTVALDEEANQIGWLRSDGTAQLDYDKLALWTTSGEEKDEHCRACFFRPACQGNHCPLFRMRTGQRPCSFEKRKIKKVLQLIHENHR